MRPMVGRERGFCRRMHGVMASRRARKRRRSPHGGCRDLELPALEQGQLDLIGLGLVSFAAFFACVFYLGWAGGEVGEAMADGILCIFGGAGYRAPVALFAAGAVMVLRPMLPARPPVRTGALCLVAALTLGLAAGSLGLGPGDTPRDGFLDPDYLRTTAGSWASPSSGRRPLFSKSAPTSCSSSCCWPACCCSPARRWPAWSAPRARAWPPPQSACAAPTGDRARARTTPRPPLAAARARGLRARGARHPRGGAGHRRVRRVRA